jgi:shikimate dehydrogenase
MILSGNAKLAGVMGWPVSHSRSPRLHGFWLERHGIDGAYVPLPVPPDGIETALRALPLLGFRGVNVTVPHKEAALSVCDGADPLARRIGAVNTVVVGADGRLAGSNSDAYGFIENLRRSSAWRSGSGPSVLLGAGGAARAACAALLDAGAGSVRVANRTRMRAEILAEEMGAEVTAVDWGARNEALDGAALLVNTTTLGMTGQPPLDIDLAALPAAAVVYDIVYVPLETPLLAAARRRGNPAVDGLGMLLHQAQPGFEAWFGVRPEVDEDLRRFILSDLRG